MSEIIAFTAEQMDFFDDLKLVVCNPIIVDAAISMFLEEFSGIRDQDTFSWGPLVVALDAILARYAQPGVTIQAKYELSDRITELFDNPQEDDSDAFLEIMADFGRKGVQDLSGLVVHSAVSSSD